MRIRRRKLPRYDVTIKSGPKDHHKLPLVINSLRWLSPQPEKVFIITPYGHMPSDTDYDDKLVRVLDREAMPGIDRTELKWRANWGFCALMAITMQIPEQRFYLDVQADNFFVGPLELFNGEGKPRFFLSPHHRHYYSEYWRLNKDLFGLERQSHPQLNRNDSFIIDFLLVDKDITKDFYGYDSLAKLWAQFVRTVSPTHCLSEFDMYAHWCLAFYPQRYEIVKGVSTYWRGKVWSHEPIWTTDEILAEIQFYEQAQTMTAISCHTWAYLPPNV